VIELSSAKRLTVDGVFVQLNYVTNAFAHFFADENRARAFWVRAEDGNQPAIDRFLDRQPVSDDDRAILRLLRLSTTTPQNLQADIATLQRLLPRILIVTHANARKPDGMPISTRAAFINMVKDAARAVGARVYDPTQRMLEMGQATALADHSAGLAHYSDAFADALCDDWLDVAIAPVIDDLVQTDRSRVASVLAPHIAALTGRLPFDALQKRLAALSDNGVDVASLSADLDLARQQITTSEDQPHTAYLLGQWDQLVGLLAQGACPQPDVVLGYAKAAPTALACQILLQGLAAHPHANILADRLATLLPEGPQDCIIPLELRSILLSHLNPLQQIKLCLAYGWDLDLCAHDLSPEDATQVVSHLAIVKGHQAALRFLAQWPPQNNIPAELSALLGKWCAYTDADRKQTVQLCNDVLAIDPQNTNARLVLRDVRRAMRGDMRAMAQTSDRTGLDQLAQVNALLSDPLPEIDLFRARASFNDGDFAETIRIGLIAAKALPENISIWVLLMRAADRAGQNTLSARCAERVIALSTPDTARLAQEAANRIGATHMVPHG